MTSCHFQSEEADTNQALYIQWGWDDTIGDQTYNGVHQLPFAIVLSLFCLSFFCNLLCVLLYLLAPQVYQYSFNSPVHPPNIVAHISQQWQWCTFWNRKRKILAHFGKFGANLCTFWWTSTGKMWHLVSNMLYSKCKRLKYFKTKKMKGMYMSWFATW